MAAETSALAIAAELFTSIENKRPDRVASLYADDIAVWHNFSNRTQSKAENLAVLTRLTESVDRIRYEVIERVSLGNRILQRHNLRCVKPDGEEVVIPACIFITIIDGHITRIEEYLDTAQSARLRS
jgi:ketosteroid isomerase-like protein